MGQIAYQMRQTRSRFRDLYGVQDAPRIAAAPGRVNLIGEHTDYNDGWVLPMAIDRHVWVAFASRGDSTLRAHSAKFVETREVRLDDLDSVRGSNWFAYIAGVVWALVEAGLEVAGIDLVVDGDLPPGSGLSSSAALEMATARALCEVSDIPWHPEQMARLGQQAENDFVGVNCGLMDQLASAAAEPGCALLLDCQSLATRAVPIPDDVRVVVMDTGAPRSLAGSAYNDRRASCDQAVEILRTLVPEIRSLRDVDRELLSRARNRMDDVTYRRATHVVEESLRPEEMAMALQTGDLIMAGHLMNNSHASLRDLYEVSSHQLNLMTDLAREHPACFGARLTGAGFGGCAIALVAADEADSFVDVVHSAYQSRVDLPSSLFVCHPVGGAHLGDPTNIEGGSPTTQFKE
jgi:galactokinase